ncbi:hypothetical protein GCM10010392_57710 [Streptomyces clavifer]|nr:hypothetical protein GCM10010392_57710 [Streptomyces clavifer]
MRGEARRRVAEGWIHLGPAVIRVGRERAGVLAARPGSVRNAAGRNRSPKSITSGDGDAPHRCRLPPVSDGTARSVRPGRTRNRSDQHICTSAASVLAHAPVV